MEGEAAAGGGGGWREPGAPRVSMLKAPPSSPPSSLVSMHC
jgi:hypothetical protein